MAENDINSIYSGIKLPFDSEAEQAVLGDILLDSECISKVAVILPKEDYFYVDIHKLIYKAMLELFTDGKTIDFITIIETLPTYK